MFGAGTAAVVQDIDGFVYQDTTYDLSWMPRKESKMLKRALEDIKEGKADDKFNWIVKIN